MQKFQGFSPPPLVVFGYLFEPIPQMKFLATALPGWCLRDPYVPPNPVRKRLFRPVNVKIGGSVT